MLGRTLKQMYQDAIDQEYSSVEHGIADLTGIPEFQLHDAHLPEWKLQSIFDKACRVDRVNGYGKVLLSWGLPMMAGGAYQGWHPMIVLGGFLAANALPFMALSQVMGYQLRKEIRHDIEIAPQVDFEHLNPIPH